MRLDARNFIPDSTLIRWASYEEGRKRPRETESLKISDRESEYEVSYTLTVNPVNATSYKRTILTFVPRTLEYDVRFQAAVMAYICEGDDPKRANGIRIGLNNSDWRITRLVVDEFEKLGMKREGWNVRLELYRGEHREMEEKEWWSKMLRIPIRCFTKPTWFDGSKEKENYNPHGRARVQRSSAIFAAIVDHTCEMVMRDLLGSGSDPLSGPESPVEGRDPFRRM